MPSLIKSNTGATGWINSQQFTTSGNFTVPAGVTKVGVRMIGGGAYASPGRGDSARIVEIEAMAVTPGAVLPVVVGSAGTIGAEHGGASTFNGRVAAGGYGQYDTTQEAAGVFNVGLGGYGRGTLNNGGIGGIPAQPGLVEVYW